MNAKKLLHHLDACGVPMVITIYPGNCFLEDAELTIGCPLEPQSDYLTFMNTHVCQSILNGLGQPDTIIHSKNGEFIYLLWKIE